MKGGGGGGGKEGRREKRDRGERRTMGNREMEKRNNGVKFSMNTCEEMFTR